MRIYLVDLKDNLGVVAVEDSKSYKKQFLNSIKGCFVGGAAGDALGYAVEFSDEDTIFQKYGACGI